MRAIREDPSKMVRLRQLVTESVLVPRLNPYGAMRPPSKGAADFHHDASGEARGVRPDINDGVATLHAKVFLREFLQFGPMLIRAMLREFPHASTRS